MDMKHSFKLLICLCAFLLCNINLYAYDFEVDGIYYNITSAENLEVSITAKAYPAPTETYTGDMTIPASVVYSEKKYSVKSVESNAFYLCTNLTSITLPNSIASIGEKVFYNCTNLVSVTLPNSITDIKHSTFRNCTSLTSITIPNSTTEIFAFAFEGCTSLTSITMSNTLTTIDGDAFEGCTSLTSIELPNSVTSIGGAAFRNCSSLVSIILPNSISSINNYTFADCTSLTSIELPNSISSIDLEAFRGCSSLVSITLPNTITSIGSCAFMDCISLTSISLPNSITFIDGFVFSGCTSLVSITLPNTITSIGAYTFNGCKSLSSIALPNSITSIGDNAFRDCTSLTSITLPDHITSIKNETFYNCKKLSTISLPNTITSIEFSAFGLCKNLSTISLPSTITSIGFLAFEACSNITSITLPYSITSIGERAFQGCDNLELVVSEIINPFVIEENVFTNGQKTILRVPKGTKELYQQTSGWKDHFKYVVEEGENIHRLTINATGDGSITSTTPVTLGVQNGSFSQLFPEGTDIILLFYPYNGKRLLSVKINDVESISETDSSKNNELTIKLSSDVLVEAEFGFDKYALTIKATGGGSVSYDENTIRGSSSTFILEEGTSATITLTPDEGYLVKSLMVNSTDVTSDITNNQYTISNINTNTTVEAKFKIKDNLTNDGLSYKVVSEDDRTVVLDKGDYGLCIEVPSSFTAYSIEWVVTGVEEGALENEATLAAIIWNPEHKFNGKPSNPNLLLYVKSEEYTTTVSMNVVVNDKAKNITLKDGSTAHNFYCPKAFVAEQITYVHNYSMKTGFNTCQGWESIVLPFDVATVNSKTGTQLVPYSLWKYGDNTRPFWLYSMNEDGWQSASAIKANIPYVISMPNNENYNATYNQSGDVVFSALNVEIKASDGIANSKYGQRIFVPNYQHQKSSSDIYALNVNNSIYTYTESDPVEGSAFISELRDVGPFEAYMMIEGNVSATRSVSIFGDDETTGIMDLPMSSDYNGNNKVYSLSGRIIKQVKDDKDIQNIPKGVYIINGKKVIK